MSSMIRSARLLFQSTLPARGATSVIGVPCASAVISIHAPRTGSDSAAWRHCIRASISIHAPRTGSDGLCCGCCSPCKNFNPRSPHGERPPRSPFTTRWSYFNPRSPHGERRAAVKRFCCNGGYFNPRSPHGERPPEVAITRGWLMISIHAPRTGSDGFKSSSGRRPAISIHAPRTGSDRFQIKPGI